MAAWKLLKYLDHICGTSTPAARNYLLWAAQKWFKENMNVSNRKVVYC